MPYGNRAPYTVREREKVPKVTKLIRKFNDNTTKVCHKWYGILSFLQFVSFVLLSDVTNVRAILLFVKEVFVAATDAAAAENPVLLPKHLIAEQNNVHQRHECDRVRFGIKFEREFNIITDFL